MAIGRSRYAPPVSTKGHSVLKTRSYGLSSRAPPTSYVTPRSSAHSTRGEEYLLADRVSNVNYLSNALLDEGYDTALRSRGRDQALLKEATNAIPRGSVRDTTALTSSLPSLGGARRFPRRFGKTGVVRKTAKSPTSLYSNTSLSREEGQSLSTSDLMASAGPQPNRSWQRFGSARSTSAARSYLEDDDEDAASPGASAYTSRASSVGPLSLSGSSGTHLASQLPLSLSRTRRALSTLPVSSSGSGLSESHLLDRMTSKPWGQSASRHLGSSSSLSSPTHRPEYESPFHEYEADVSPAHSPSYYPSSPIAPRRRQKVLSTSRRPAGNYYERLLRKRGKQHGRFGPYYDLESIEGSDLSGVLSDRESLDGGTYDNDNDDYESSSVSPSRQYLSSAVSPYDPYFVDQDTEFVPFKPSRPLLTKGLLEITPLGHEDSEGSNSHSLPSPTTDLSLSRYLPSSLISAATSSMSDSTLSPRLPYRSIVPYTFSPSSSPPPASSLPSPSDASLAVVPSSSFSSPTPNQQLLETLVSNAVTRARNAINDLAIPEYSGASLLLSVEGAGTSPDGKRVDFTYTPPPIPLYGRSVVLNDRLLGIKPAQTIKPLDNFIAGYIERMSALRAALTQRVDKDREKRVHYGLKPLDTGPFSSGTSSTYTPYTSSYTPRSTSSYRSYTPSYTQSHDYVPVKHLSSQKLEHLPVTSFRKRQDDGQTERVDVFSLGEFRPRLSSSTAKAITIPESATGGYQLSVLDKINIKVSSESYATPQTSVASRRVARGDSVGTRAASVPPRPPPKQEVDRSSAAAPPPISRRPVVVLPSPQGASRATSVPPVVVFRDDPSRAKALPTMTREERRSKLRGYSVPPARPAVAPSPYRAALKPIPEVREPALLPPTTGLRAHRVPRRFLTRPGLSRYGYEHKSGDIGRLPYTLPSPKPVPMRESLRDFPKVYVPSQGQRPSNRSKAAIIASKLEPDPIKRRRPRSEYAASKYREMRREKLESPTGGNAVSGGSRSKSSSYSSRQYGSTGSTRGTGADDEKLNPLMSWKYRLDSVTSPSDLLYQPSSLIRIREQVKNAKEKMSRTKEMLEKYLPDEGIDSMDVAASIRMKMSAMEKRNPNGGGADPDLSTNGVEGSARPMSDLRRRIRRTLNKSRVS